MNGRLLIGGGFFTHDQIAFGQLLTSNPLFHVTNIRSLEFDKSEGPIDEDFIVILGMKGMIRTLSKRGFRNRHIRQEIKSFFRQTLPRHSPLIIVDDFSLPQAKFMLKPMLKFFSTEFNLRLYLLREYLSNGRYPNWIQPFSLPADSYPKLRVEIDEKNLQYFFHGNASSRDRVTITKKLKSQSIGLKSHLVVTYGGIKNTVDRLSRDDYLSLMSRSKFCLDFSGSGYDCYRYHEIASVGSVIVSPNYPLVRQNDYKDMKSCIKYSSFRDLKVKIHKILDSDILLDDIIGCSVEHFERYHTSEKRTEEFLQYISDVVHD